MSEVVLPRLGWNMEEGIFQGWLKSGGDRVRAGEPLFSVEGDKSIQEIEATEDGILRIAPGGPKEGDTLAVGTVIGHIEAVAQATVTPSTPPTSTAPEPPPPVTPSEETVANAPAPPLLPTVEEPRRQAISPRARRAAEERNIPTDRLFGTGRNGRIRERDVLAATPPLAPASHNTTVETQRVTPLRRTIAQRMAHSSRTTAPVTLHATFDATNLINLREQFKTVTTGTERPVPSLTDFFVKLTALTLRQHSLLNSRWDEDHITTIADVHIGIAVDTEAGLLVPVLRDVPSLSMSRIASQTKRLIDKARSRKLSPEELQGGTFTITNLGSFGIESFTPIINWPECAILGIGAIRPQPTVVNEQIVARNRVTVSLTFDHRVVDGAPAARFLESLRQRVENPAAWLVE